MSTATLPGSRAVTCPQWCAGDCDDWTDGTYHGSAFTDVPARSESDGPVTVSVSASRLDRAGQEPVLAVDLLVGPQGRISMVDLTFTPEQARQLAAVLLTAAGNADGGVG